MQFPMGLVRAWGAVHRGNEGKGNEGKGGDGMVRLRLVLRLAER